MPDALSFLERAAALLPDAPRYGYVYAVALNDVGQGAKAIEVLKPLHERFPADTDIVVALATYSADAGHLPAALDYARELVAVAPGDRAAQQLLTALKAKANGLGPVR
jgi:predicted Zn-dependent protease